MSDKVVGRIITIKHRDLVEFEDTFHQSGCALCSPTDNREHYLKFKYACGKNWNRVSSLLKIAQKHVNDLIAPAKEYWEFLKEREAIAKENSKVDDKGNPVLVEKNGQEVYDIDPAKTDYANECMELLNKKYDDAIQQHLDKQAQVEKYLDETITFELFTVPWDYVPDQVNGAYLDKLACMCTGAPEMEAATK